ncbi:MAG: Protein phosphatase PP2A regulatory subunit B [Alyxoria varia]|nr:MAG: Protein phosphatase PP2A regulatory subunit B [Alyxoria varia]
MNGHCSPNPCHPRHPKAQINGDSSADATVVAWESFPLDIRISDLIAEHKIDTDQFVLLDSGTKDDWAILSSSSTAWSFRYSLRRGGSTFTPLDNALTEHDNKLQLRGDPWNWLRCISSSRNFTGGPSDTPFWGGFVGYFSYELGLNQISITPYTQTAGRTDKVPDYDDISLLYSTETIVYHIPTKTVYLISLNRDTWWIKRTRALLRSHAATANGSMKPQHAPIVGRTVHPDRGQYLKKIEKAQERIRAGDSYELCLTATTTVQDLAAQRFKSAGKESHNENSTSTRRTRKNAHRFNDLRSKNPAAFMSFLQLNGMTLLSASPEEFLNFDASTRTARMRPIKGTLSKLRPDGKTPVSFSEAETELHDPKTVAENLMILDLIRNDLSKVSIDVTCPKPLWVEEISTMYQLVSTIEARVEPKVTAWDLLKATLPPGSMTGAPKRRSCEILQELEGEGSFRGVYSGIVGYIDVRGHSRTSVNIRNIARYPGEDAWRVGAGGAITCLSDPVAEWEERQLKTRGVCRVFEGDFGVLETMRWDPEDQQVVHVEEHARRLSKSLRFFGFSNPLYNESSGNLVPPSKCNGSSHSRKRPAEQVPDEAVALWNLVRSRPSPSLKSQNLRISLAIDRSGTVTRFDAIPITITNLNTTTIPIDTTMQDPNNDINNKPAEIETVKVRLDPCSIHVAALEPFISHKTTHRDHYSAARERAGVQGREEVLMFSCCSDRIPDVNGERCDGGSGGGRGGTSDHTVQIGAPDDLLTEGSYTNVAIFDQDRSVWVTPARGCLQGIEREKLLQSGTIVQGDVRRKHLQNNPRVWLFNSVRGVFEGKLELLDG